MKGLGVLVVAGVICMVAGWIIESMPAWGVMTLIAAPYVLWLGYGVKLWSERK